VLGVVVLRLGILEMVFFVESVVMVVVVERTDFIGIPLGGGPHFVIILEFLAHFICRIWAFIVAFEAAVANNLVNHVCCLEVIKI